MPPHALNGARRVRLLQEDPELGAQLSAEDFAQVRRYALVELAELERGLHVPWKVGNAELLGLLVLDGHLIRSVQVAERACGELVGPGSILRPWDHFGLYAPLPFEVSWRVIEPVRLGLLDQRLVTVGARWPSLIHAIVQRAVGRSHALALDVAIRCLQHIELRLLVLFWHLADQFGRVTADGTIVPVRLTHGDVAELIGGQRPSTSAHLSALAKRDVLVRREDRTWLLRGEPPAELRDMRARATALRGEPGQALDGAGLVDDELEGISHLDQVEQAPGLCLDGMKNQTGPAGT
jgi:CRP/FNR family cyclic AMP-dependent transcriptional regulator